MSNNSPGAGDSLQAAAFTTPTDFAILGAGDVPNLACPACVASEKFSINQNSCTDALVYIDDDVVLLQFVLGVVNELADRGRLAVIEDRNRFVVSLG